MKKIDRSFRTVMALFICFVSVLLAIAPAVSYIAGTPDSLMSYATDSENAAEDAKGTDAAEGTGGAKAADEEKAPAETPAETANEGTEKETPKEEAVTDDTGSSDDNGYPAVELSQTVGGVEIGLSAGKGVFPEGVTLSASRVKGTELKKVDKALKAERGDASSVDSSYTFDIKVLDAEGEEVQPADGKDVSLSFAAKKVADKKLSTRVYHIEDGKKELDATELKVSTDGDTATVETDGFSYYTVEFTYGDKQYVLEGDGVVKLDDLLKAIGIEGEVKGVSVSDPELFGVIRGTKKGVSYATRFMNGETKKVPTNDPKGTVRYVASYKPFNTEEWMDITMKDGRKYHVIVTDALMGDNTIDKNIPVVSQGVGSEFAETIPVATIWIDEGIFTEKVESRHVGDHGDWSLSFIPGPLMNNQDNPENIGFQVEKLADDDSQKGSAQYYGNHFVIYDSNEKTLDGEIKTTNKQSGEEACQSYNYFEGVVGTYKYSNAAVYTDSNGNEQSADVYIEYSNPMISIETPTNATKASEWNNVKVGLFGPNIITNGKDKNNGQSYALDIKVRPYVRTHSEGAVIGGEEISGRFYFPMVHLNVKRSVNRFKTFYRSNPELENEDKSTHLYSEQVILKDGLAADKEGNEIFIPGGDGDPYFHYIPAVEISEVVGSENYGQYVIYPPINNDDITDELYIDGKTDPVSARDSFYYGFLTCAENGAFAFRHNSSSLTNESGMHSYVLTSSSNFNFNYRLRHSTETVNGEHVDDGGTILTTKYGNHTGKPADDGDTNIIGPSTKAVAYGQTVVYTFNPKPGYSLKNVYVWDGTGEFPSIAQMKTRSDVKKINEGDGTDGTYEEHDDNNDGVPDRYTFTFHGIKSNKAIHVVWDKTLLEVQKKTSGSGKDDKDTFNFKIKITRKGENDQWNPVPYVKTGDASIDDRFTEITGSNGAYSFTLTNGEKLQIPTAWTKPGDKYEIEEIPKENGKYGTDYDWDIVGDASKSGDLEASKTASVTFTNKRKKSEEVGKVPLTVKKVWEDDETLRPKNLTVTIEKAAAIGVNIEDFREALLALGLDSSEITGIRYGTSNEYLAAKNKVGANISSAKAAPNKGEGFVYFWIDPEEPKAIKFYSEKTIYLFNKVDYDDNKTADGERIGLCQDFYALEDISGLAHVHTDFCTSFANMFNDCLSLYDLHPIAKWNTTNVRSLQKFLQADNPNSTGTGKGPMIYDNLSPLKNWNTENVETMRRAFKGAMKLKDISPVKDWDTGRVISLYETFFRTEVGTINNQTSFQNWNVTCVGDFYQMFRFSAIGSQTTPAADDLPDWGKNESYPRQATDKKWDTTGTYLPKDSPKTPADIKNWNKASEVFGNQKKLVLSTTAHDVDEEDGSWIYTFYVDDDGAEWNVYETIPKAYDSEYRVSASYTNNLEGEDLITSGDTMGVGKKNNPYKGAEPRSTTTLTNHQKVHKLTIKKDLPFVENSEENAQPFEFNIVLTTNEGNPYDISQTDQYKALEENGSIRETSEGSKGKYTLTIKGEASEEFELPAGIKYTVMEDVDKLPPGWRLLRSNNTSGVLTEDKEASFANTNSTKFIVNKIWKGDSYNGVRLPARPIESDKVKIEVEADGQTYVSDPENMFRDDPADYWAYEFDIPPGTDVTSVKETVLPEHYDYEVIRPEKDGDPYTVVNTLKEKKLTVKKNTQGDQNGIFDFEVRFWINNSTEKSHPVKIGHSQIFKYNTPMMPNSSLKTVSL